MTERGTSYAFDGDDPIYEHDDYYRVYEYDLQNRLVKVSGYIDGVLSVLATYGYAGDNLRLTKTASGITTRYVHGVDGNELYRVTASDSVSTVWLFGRKLVEIEPASGTEERTYLHTDHLGSVVAATDEAGQTIWRGDNSAFGVATADAGLASRTASYTGKDYDSEAGLYYFNARWYDAELGRFISEDPARDDVNWYVYCANNPMRFTDPTGMQMVYGKNGPDYDYDAENDTITKYSSNADRTEQEAKDLTDNYHREKIAEDIQLEAVVSVGIAGTVGGGTGTVTGSGLMFGIEDGKLLVKPYWKAGVVAIGPASVSGGVEVGVSLGTSNPKDLEGWSPVVGGSIGELFGAGLDISPSQYPGASLFFGFTGKLPFPGEGHAGGVYLKVED